ncbi:MAG: hypothetical protein RLZZ324_674 [Candidatus Parcubacteria bacterium]|jgi:hypothetical protein
MPPLSELPGDLSREKFLNALRRVGFIVDMRGGNGSHCKVEWKNGKEFPVKKDINKYVLKYLLKEIEEATGVTWERIKEEL